MAEYAYELMMLDIFERIVLDFRDHYQEVMIGVGDSIKGVSFAKADQSVWL